MSSAIVDKKFLPKLTKSCVGAALFSSHDTDEIGTDISNLEREMRSLHNRLAQIECNTDQKLAALGQRLHTLNKTIDNLNSNSETSPLKQSNSVLETPVNIRSCYPSNQTYNASAVNCPTVRELSLNKPKWSSPLVYDRPRAGDDSDHCRHKLTFSSILSRSLNYGREIGEAARLKAELNIREKNLEHQERELTSRRNQLLSRIKSLTSQSWSDNALPQLESTPKSRSGFVEKRSQSQWKDDSPSVHSQIVF